MSEPSPSPAKPCPICGKPAAQDYLPFCSKRCADVDLNRWFTGVYSVPVEAAPDDLDDRGQTADDE
jgi:endogenous inhibitor of DNA gyrase (YacG/DUF329 family)